jgi:hypothetical protein
LRVQFLPMSRTLAQQPPSARAARLRVTFRADQSEGITAGEHTAQLAISSGAQGLPDGGWLCVLLIADGRRA